MKIRFDRNKLAKALQKVGSVVEKKSTMPILGNLLLDARDENLFISATDLEIGIQCACPVKIDQEGKVCVPARNLIEVIKELPDETGTLQKKDNHWVEITSGSAHFKMVGVSSDDFPQMLSEKNFQFGKLRATLLRDAIEKTSFAISTDEMRYNLNGAYIETDKGDSSARGLRMVATDGHRLAMSFQGFEDSESFELTKGVILPRKGVLELRRLLSEMGDQAIEIAVNESNAAFRGDGVLMYMRLVVGEFPDYRTVIPKANKKKLVVDRDHFSNSLRRVSLLSEGKSKCVRLGLGAQGVHLKANSPELGEAEEDVSGEFSGEKLDIGFNARYILDALSAANSDKIVFEFDHAQSPGVIKIPNDARFLGVIMPMRV